jgi:hypothetical protein
MTTQAASSGNISVVYPVGPNGSNVTFESYVASIMSSGIAQQPFGGLGDGDGTCLGPSTAVDAVAWSNYVVRFGVPIGVTALN